MHWLLKLFIKIFILNSAYTTNTDIGVIYEHGIFLIKNASILSSKAVQKADTLIQLPYKFEYPIAVAYDSLKSVFYVSDANDKNTEIFSFSLDSENRTVNSLVSRQKQSLINAISYDPVKNQLIWTDSFKHGIYYANLQKVNSTLNSTLDPNLLSSNEIINPRGITTDYCNRLVYWTERHSKNPVIKRYNMINKSVEIVKTAQNGSFFQGVDYNIERKELIWAETLGDDERNSSCSIVTKSLETGVESVIGSFIDCYPFALTSDSDNIYWSDWSRGGIMRLPRRNDSNEGLVKLANTPALKSEEGRHNGAFGIVNLKNYFNPNDSACIFHVESTSLANKNDLKNDSNDKSLSESTMSSGSQGLIGSFQDSYVFHNLRLIIIILAFGCSFFFTTTLLLLSRVLFGRDGCLRNRFLVRDDTAFNKGPIKKIKPHRRFQSKPKSFDGQLCARDNDGIKIDIEDCCQMTLCDTPCYTSLKKEGKGYKLSSKSTNEDKEELLQNIGTI